MSRIRRKMLALSSVAALAAGSLVVPATASAAPVAPAPPGASGHAGYPGKGDADGDRIADDLELAVARAKPADRLGVIVQGVSPAAARQVAPSLATRLQYQIIPAFAGTVTAGQVTALARIPGVTRVELDGVARIFDAAGDHDYGVEAARAAGLSLDGTLDGDGIGICVIDTGIDPNHEQLTNKVVGWRDWVNLRTTPYDDHGHGTHVSSIAAGDGTGSNATQANAYGGVARGASLIGAKVLSSSGSGSDADVVDAINWCAQRPDVRIISMSLGSPGGGDGSDAGSQAVNAAVTSYGKVVVVAAGNDGDGEGTIASPGVATQAITVGAASDYSVPAGQPGHDKGLTLAGFSSRGPTTNPSAPLKPDLVAPGVSVVAAQSGTTAGYVAYSGTSMATPFVAGSVALALEAVPTASPAQVKTAIRDSARDAGTPGPDNDWGHGLLDVRGFIDTLRGVSPAATGPLPAQAVVSDSVPNNGTRDVPIEVTTAGQPLGISLQINGQQSCSLFIFGICLAYEWSPDLDATLISPSGSVVAGSQCPLATDTGYCGSMGRFETLGVASAEAGTWIIRVQPFADAPNNGTGGAFTVTAFGALDGSAPPPPPPPPPPPSETSPSAPTSLTASAQNKLRIGLTWNDTSGNETTFLVERCTGSGCTTFTQIATLPANSTVYTDSGLSALTTYRYRVRAHNGVGDSAYSNIASATTKRR